MYSGYSGYQRDILQEEDNFCHQSRKLCKKLLLHLRISPHLPIYIPFTKKSHPTKCRIACKENE